MNTLRVLIADPQARERAVPWALFGADGRRIDHGVAPPSSWPAAGRIEAVLAASAVRIASLALPPLAAARVPGAAAFALEDHLAGPSDAQHLAVSKQSSDGRVRVVVAAQRDAATLASRRDPRFARAIAEPDLATPLASAWRWCASEAATGFVLLPDGSAFPADGPRDAELPAELSVALERARRDGALPSEIVVDAPASDEMLVRWSRETGVHCIRGAPWRWHDAAPERFAAAIDVLQGAFAASADSAPRRSMSRLVAPAIALLAVAAGIHVVAAFADWIGANVDSWRVAREWSALAREAGVADADARDPAAARIAIAKKHADVRHGHGLAAPSDALPLLARAAPALATLPAGALRGATYADDHWTLDVVRLDAAALARLDAALRDAGTPALAATTDAGTRVRLGE